VPGRRAAPGRSVTGARTTATLGLPSIRRSIEHCRPGAGPPGPTSERIPALRAPAPRSVPSARLQPHVRHHRREQQREVGERVEVEAERQAPVGTAVEPDGAGDEEAAEDDRAGEVDEAERARAEGELRDRVEEDRVEDDLPPRLLLAA